MLKNFIVCLECVSPIMMLMLFGFLLSKTKTISEKFGDDSQTIVFNYVLPINMFLTIATTSIKEVFDGKLVGYSLLAYGLLVIIGIVVSKILSKDPKQQVAISQGLFRANYAIIGIPLTEAVFPNNPVTANAAVILGIYIPLAAVVAVLLMEFSLSKNQPIKKVLISILVNPIFTWSFAGLIFSVLRITGFIPNVVMVFLRFISNMCTPLSLIAIGCSFVLSKCKETMGMTVFVSFLKTFGTLILFMYPAYLLGITGEKLGILCIFLASPSAVANYAMTRSVGGDYDLSGNIIVVSTIMSMFAVVFGIAALKTFGLF